MLPTAAATARTTLRSATRRAILSRSSLSLLTTTTLSAPTSQPRFVILQRTRNANSNSARHYSSLRRPRQAPIRKITPRKTGASSAESSAAAASSASESSVASSAAQAGVAGSHIISDAANSGVILPPSTDPNAVVGLDIAATPAVVPEDPFGALQPHDAAASVLSQPALIMTRQIELMNVLVGFEQANKYAIVDPTGQPIGFIAEEETSFVNAMTRQMFKTHRAFKASVLDNSGNVILKIQRPFAFINSRIMIYTPDDRLIGEVQQEWHLIRRRYNMFTVTQPEPGSSEPNTTTTTDNLERIQFAHIDGGFLALDFDMHDEQGQRMASVNRNFVGFARELFTDSGQYALRFDAAVMEDLQLEQGLASTPVPQLSSTGSSSSTAATVTATPTSLDGTKDAEQEKALAQAKEIQAEKDESALVQLEDRGGLTLDQRAIMLACAVSIDFDYFSRHSGNGGLMPIGMMGGGHSAPVPSASGDGVGTVVGAGAGAAAGQVLGGAAAGDVAAGGAAGAAADIGGAMGGGGSYGAGGSGGGSVGGGAADMGAGTGAAGVNEWGDPVGETNEWGEEVWAEDSSSTESTDSWFGGGGDSGGGGGGGGFDWGDLL